MREINGYGGLVGAILLVLVVVAIGVVDLLAAFSRGRVLTVTEVIQTWSRQWPVIAFSLGFVMGHLFFPTWVYPGREEHPTQLPPVLIHDIGSPDKGDMKDPLAAGPRPTPPGELHGKYGQID
jgi:hypothetical protein